MSFQNIIQQWKVEYQGKTAIQEMSGRKVSYDNLYEDVMAYADYFHQQSDKEVRIAILGATSYPWLCHVYGALTAGMTVLAIDPLLPIGDITSLLQSMDAQVAYLADEDTELQLAMEQMGVLVKSFLQEDYVKKDFLQSNLTFASDGDIIFFTSGTSGKAKGAVLPFSAIYKNAKKLSQVTAVGIEGNMYTPLPLYHLYATIMVLVFLGRGQTVCLGNPRNVLQELAYFRPSSLVLVPAMAEYLMQKKAIGEETKLFMVAGAKCEKSLEQQAKEYGLAVQNLYGASEAAGVMGISIAGQDVERLFPVEGMEVWAEPDGELVIRALDYMKEYYKNPEATAQTLREGCIYLGDMGIAYEDGSFTPLGRKQDVIAMKNGNKLYCEEIDAELKAIDGVEDACIIYVDAAVTAVVVSQQGRDVEQVRKNIKKYNKQQPYFRKLDRIWICQKPLPRTRMGKLKRNEVVKQYQIEQQREGKEKE